MSRSSPAGGLLLDRVRTARISGVGSVYLAARQDGAVCMLTPFNGSGAAPDAVGINCTGAIAVLRRRGLAVLRKDGARHQLIVAVPLDTRRAELLRDGRSTARLAISDGLTSSDVQPGDRLRLTDARGADAIVDPN